MRGILAIGLSLAFLSATQARADDVSVPDVLPGERTLELTALSTLTGSIAQAQFRLQGIVATGDISLSGLDAAGGGINVVQLATGAGNLQQSAIALSIVIN